MHDAGGSQLSRTACIRGGLSPASVPQVLSVEGQQGRSSRRLQRPREVSLVVTRAGQWGHPFSRAHTTSPRAGRSCAPALPERSC